MKEESFLLVSLEGNKAKQLAQVISNDTCRKILDQLAKGPTTETDIAEKLSLPISTVHYNLKNLVQSNLVVTEEFHYSKKGKEVNHYSLANKLIIIAPKQQQNIAERLKSLFIVAAIGVGIALIYELFTSINVGFKSSADMATLNYKAMETAPVTMVRSAAVNEPQIATWFLVGVGFALITILAVDYIRRR